MKTNAKKLLSLLLTLVMIVGIFPAVAFAAGGEADYELRVLDFEGEQWDALIDEPQLGGPLLGGEDGFTDVNDAYKWTDEHTQLHSILCEYEGLYHYLCGGHAISNYACADYKTYREGEDMLTVYDADAVGMARTGGGHNGSDNFAVHHTPYWIEEQYPALSFADGVARVVDHMYVNFTVCTLNYLIDQWTSEPEGDFHVTATGYNGETRTGETRIYLSDGEDLIKDWTKWDLSSLGKVTKIEFHVDGSDKDDSGVLIQPACFAYDDVAVRFEVEGGEEPGEPESNLRILTFEDEDYKGSGNYVGGSDWSSLIDSPQYGGPLLYPQDGDVTVYNWHDQGNTELAHRFTDEWGDHQYWGGGEAISNYAAADIETYGDFMSQLTVFDADAAGLARTGGGHNGSDNFAVHYGYVDSSDWGGTLLQNIYFADNVPRVIDHMYVNNTCYAINCYVNGNSLTPSIGENDWVKLVATGHHEDGTTATTSIYLVNGPDNIVMDWTKWDLSSLGEVLKVELNVTGSSDNGYGFSQPAYFAYDDIAVVFEPEGGEEPEEPEEPSYTVTLPEDTSVITGETVFIPATVGHNADETTYNAFDMSFTYDKSILELTSTEIEGLTIRQSEDPENPNIGIVRIMGYGFDREVDTAPFGVTFKAIRPGTCTVTMTSSKVSSSADAITGDASEATVVENHIVVIVGGYPVTLPEGFTGASTANPGEDYTFSEPVDYYDYTVSATVGGEDVEITDNGDGSYTIPAASVTGSIVITATKAGQVFNVTLGEDMSGAATAQYMSDYVATLTKAEGFTYEVAVTVGGEAYTGYSVSEDAYTIPGEDITGDIVFIVTKTEIPAPEFTVTFEGDGAGDAVGEPTAIAGEDYTFTVVQGDDPPTEPYPQYEITATVDGEPVDLSLLGGQYFIWYYEINGEDITGDIVITITKIPSLDVEVNSYVELDGKTVFLVTATGTLEEGKAYAYDGNAMFYSEVYEAWCYLTIEEGEFNAEIAKDNIVATETSYITLTETCDVNMSGLVDINDAQLVYDIYNGKYEDFTTVEMQKFLNADTNGDKTVNVTDAAAVVAAIQ